MAKVLQFPQQAGRPDEDTFKKAMGAIEKRLGVSFMNTLVLMASVLPKHKPRLINRLKKKHS